MMDEADKDGLWNVLATKCPYCAHEWVAVAPVGHAPLECPACTIQPDDDG